MKYDFTTIMDRRGMDALAVDGLGTGWAPKAPPAGVDPIPMWVADMNFPTAPAITKAIIDRASHPAFGYFEPREAYYRAIIQWHREHNGVTAMEPEHIGYENGVLGGVISALNVLCARGDKVLVHSPTYIGFTNSLENNGYRLVHSPLVKDGEGVWRMDFGDMEARIVRHGIRCAILCSPHNPTGRVWERWELERAMELFKKHDVWVISDEIWSDLTLFGHRHIPTQSVSEDARQRTVALYAPSKTFNLAGLVGSYHVIYNDRLRARVRKEASLSHYNSMNVLSMHALMAGYSPAGRAWLEELRQVLGENVDYACAYIREHFRGVEVSRPQGTYMLFLDCTAWCEKHGKTLQELRDMGWNAGVIWQDGRPFHGPCHLRVNLALPLARVREAMERLDKQVFNGEGEA